MCDYSWPRVSSLFGLREPALLISDGQNADHIATYERVSAAYPKSLWALCSCSRQRLALE